MGKRGIRPLDLERKDPKVLILAGGEGVRFAPLSTPEKPKQFHPIIDQDPLIVQTMNRAKKIVVNGYSDIYISVNYKHVPLIRELFPKFPDSNLIVETEKKNTAPTMALLSYLLYSQDPKSILVSLPCDHFIGDESKFLTDISHAVTLANRYLVLVTLGISTRYAATEYGYLKKTNKEVNGAYIIENFIEKPNEEKAKEYFADDNYYWNSGMFVWTTAEGCDAFVEHYPSISNLLVETLTFGKYDQQQVDEYFRKVDSISVDYAIMEKHRKVLMVPANFEWSDIGSWRALKDLYDSGKVSILGSTLEIMKEQLKWQ